jgi:hypothetical protein
MSKCVMPDKDTQAFLLSVLDNSTFPPKLAAFVRKVKADLQGAAVASNVAVKG